MELQKEQIEELFRFTAKKYVHWYDLQVELVDHLASRIEEELERAPGLSFEKALEKVYKGFGIFGFGKVVQEKTTQLQRRSWRLWWSAFRTFFGWPRILALLAAIAVLWQAMHLVPGWVLFAVPLLAYGASEVFLLRFRWKQRVSKKRLLLLDVSPLRYSSGFFFFMVAANFDNLNSRAGFAMGILCLISVLVNLASVNAHREVQHEAEALYPTAFANS